MSGGSGVVYCNNATASAKDRAESRHPGTNAVETSGSRHDQYHPSPDLARHVEHYWCIDSDLRDVGPQRVEILPHPSVHLTFDRSGDATVRGLTLGKFSNLLQGKDGVLGVKFTPGGL